MADDKRYYWLKLKRDFFKRHDIKIIESQENGKDYVLFYLKLLAESVDHNGRLRFSDTIPYDEKMLSVITNTNVDVVRSAMKILTDLNLIEIFEDRTIFMVEIQNIVGSEGWSAERVRKHRQKDKQLLQCNTTVTLSNVEKESEKELDPEKEKDESIIHVSIAEIPDPDLKKKYEEREQRAREFMNKQHNKGGN